MWFTSLGDALPNAQVGACLVDVYTLDFIAVYSQNAGTLNAGTIAMRIPYIESDDDGAVPGGLVLNPLLAIRLEVPPDRPSAIWSDRVVCLP